MEFSRLSEFMEILEKVRYYSWMGESLENVFMWGKEFCYCIIYLSFSVRV